MNGCVGKATGDHRVGKDKDDARVCASAAVAALLPTNGEGFAMTALLQRCEALDQPTVLAVFPGGLSEACWSTQHRR